MSSRATTWKVLLAALALGAIVVAALELPGASRGFSSAWGRLSAERLPWFGVAVAFEFASLLSFALVQRELLAARGLRMRLRSLLRLSVAANGLQSLLPAGVLPAGGWLIAQYRRVRASTSFAFYVVLGTVLATTLAVLGLLLVGAAVAGLASAPVLLLAAIGLALLGTGVVAVAHHLGARPERVEALGVATWARRLAEASDTVAAAARNRVGPAGGPSGSLPRRGARTCVSCCVPSSSSEFASPGTGSSSPTRSHRSLAASHRCRAGSARWRAARSAVSSSRA